MNATFQANEQYAQLGEKTFSAFIEETKQAYEVTTALLLKLLDDNKDTEYGKKYHFSEIHSVEEYQKNVPVITYDDVAESIERMVKGEKNILTSYSYSHMNETSGTVGNPKMIPMTDFQSDIFGKYNSLLLYGILNRSVTGDWKNGRAFCTSSGTCRKTESGITVGEASAKMADYVKGGVKAVEQMMRTMYTSPIEGLIPAPGADTKYIHARFALEDREVRGIITGFYSVAVLYLQYIADKYEILIHDIETGTISDEIELPPEVRESLLQKISPNPERAQELRDIFRNGSDFPFVRKIWKNFMYICGVGGDGFSVYDTLLKIRFIGDGYKNIYSGITASEGLWSVPVETDNTSSAIAPGASFIEYLPVDAGNDFSRIVTMDKLEVGKIYELIITNLSGLYRYRMSDAVRVTGFYNKTPMVEFMYRVNKTINLAEEKTTEKALQITVEKTAEEFGFALADFSVYPDTSVTPNRYIFLIEPCKIQKEIDMERLKESIFRHLCEANPVYYDCYADKWLDKPEVDFLQLQTSLLYRDMMVMKGASLNQLKPVRIIVNERQRKFFFNFLQSKEEC